MSVAAPPSFDKTIGRERRAEGAQTDLSRTIRAARERLTSISGSPRFDLELLIQHALALRTVGPLVPLPIILTGFFLSGFVGVVPALAWGAFAVFGYGILFAVLQRFEKRAKGATPVARWTRAFFAGHLASGLGWAYLAAIGCSDCEPLRFEIFQFSVLFLAVAVTALVTWTLRFTIAVAFLPLVAVLLVRILGEPETVSSAMRGMLLAAVPFFAVVAARIRGNGIERMKHQAEKDELIAELDTARVVSEEARRRAEDANLAKSRFLATMSHELRTPLNAILGFSEVMSNEILGPIGNDSYRDYVRDIHSSGQHLLDVINEILDLSRVEAGRYQLDEEAVDLVATARDCLGYIRLKSEAKGLRLDVQFEKDLPLLWADQRAVRQVVLNILSNAVKFTPRGGTITLRVGWTAGGGQYVSVRDNGPGIPEHEIPIVLSAFGQGSIAIKAAEQGTGLGLPIVQALLHLHDGDFTLLSKLREGTEAIAAFPHSRVLEVMPAFSEDER